MKYIRILEFFSDCITHITILYLFSLVYHITQNMYESDFCNSIECVCLVKTIYAQKSAIGISLNLNTDHYCWYFVDGIFPIPYLFLFIVWPVFSQQS